ncbi:Hypothetical protein A7982_04992 [Minicystis rosea]|nr:Hypothetical protein A7982_04992 [Minicystis rosea]
MTAVLRRCATGLGLAAALASFGGTASAQDPKARAQQLFQEGIAAIEKGDSATGCGKLRESLSLFAVSNTLFNVAQCDEKEGKPGAALEHWKRGLGLIDATDPRSKLAKERIAALEPKVPLLRIVVPLGQAETKVTLDGQEIAASALETRFPVDPGKHTIVIRVAGRQDRKHEVVLAEGERTELVATQGPALAAPPPPPGNTGPVAVKGPGAPPGSETPPPPPSSSSGLRVGGFVTLGIGGAALIAAGATGAMVLAHRSTANEMCGPEKNACPPGFASQLSSDKGLVVGNTIAWSVGIAGVATGAILLIVSSRKSTTTTTTGSVMPAPLAVPGGGGMSVVGRF